MSFLALCLPHPRPVAKQQGKYVHISGTVDNHITNGPPLNLGAKVCTHDTPRLRRAYVLDRDRERDRQVSQSIAAVLTERGIALYMYCHKERKAVRQARTGGR